MNKYVRHIETLIREELEDRKGYLARGLVNGLSDEDYHDYADDVAFEEEVLAYFIKMSRNDPPS